MFTRDIYRVIINYLPLLDIINFSQINKKTYNYYQLLKYTICREKFDGNVENLCRINDAALLESIIRGREIGHKLLNNFVKLKKRNDEVFWTIVNNSKYDKNDMFVYDPTNEKIFNLCNEHIQKRLFPQTIKFFDTPETIHLLFNNMTSNKQYLICNLCNNPEVIEILINYFGESFEHTIRTIIYTSINDIVNYLKTEKAECYHVLSLMMKNHKHKIIPVLQLLDTHFSQLLLEIFIEYDKILDVESNLPLFQKSNNLQLLKSLARYSFSGRDDFIDYCNDIKFFKTLDYREHNMLTSHCRYFNLRACNIIVDYYRKKNINIKCTNCSGINHD